MSSRRSPSIRPFSRRGIGIALFFFFFLYLSLYTWNIRSGTLDKFSTYTGLEFSRWVLFPGVWVKETVTGMWSDYIALVDVRKENVHLGRQVQQLSLALALAQEEVTEVQRLRSLLVFKEPEGWDKQGARVIAHRLGPNALLETLVVDKGSVQGVGVNTPVITPDGLAGRVLRTSRNAATVLLITDPNSKIPVRSQQHRSTGILAGQGPGEYLELRYVPINTALDKGELLLASGLAGIFPRGTPVARVVSVEQSAISLFLKVKAQPLVPFKKMEEVFLLSPSSGIPDTAALSDISGTLDASGMPDGSADEQRQPVRAANIAGQQTR